MPTTRPSDPTAELDPTPAPCSRRGAVGFVATRDQLTTRDAGVDPVAAARALVSDAIAHVSMVAVDPVGTRRIDAWVGAGGAVSHAWSADPSGAVAGAVIADSRGVRSHLATLLASLAERGVATGEAIRCGERVEPRPVELHDAGALGPATLPPALDAVVVVTVERRPSEARRTFAIGVADHRWWLGDLAPHGDPEPPTLLVPSSFDAAVVAWVDELVADDDRPVAPVAERADPSLEDRG